jgi:hypothetical protein
MSAAAKKVHEEICADPHMESFRQTTVGAVLLEIEARRRANNGTFDISEWNELGSVRGTKYQISDETRRRLTSRGGGDVVQRFMDDVQRSWESDEEEERGSFETRDTTRRFIREHLKRVRVTSGIESITPPMTGWTILYAQQEMLNCLAINQNKRMDDLDGDSAGMKAELTQLREELAAMREGKPRQFGVPPPNVRNYMESRRSMESSVSSWHMPCQRPRTDVGTSVTAEEGQGNDYETVNQ